MVARAGTVVVTLIALTIALVSDKSVFALVLDAWGVLGAAFAPLLTLVALGRRPGQWSAIAMIAAGVATVYWWPLSGWSYAIFPGMVSGFLVYLLLLPFSNRRSVVAPTR
jgi:sodium/proline symporter